MNDWMGNFISQCLADIPKGKYRCRAEKELRDHMETLCLSLTENGLDLDQARREALRTMGEPDRLQEEYRAAWRRTLPGRLAALGRLLKAWAVGFAVMLGVELLVSYGMGSVQRAVPMDSLAPQIRRMIRGSVLYLNTVLNLRGFWLRYILLLVPALTMGAFYLSRKFRASRHPVWQISVGLSFYCAFTNMLVVWFEAALDHIAFWEEFRVYVPYNARYFSFTFALCVLLGVAFGHRSVRRKKASAA